MDSGGYIVFDSGGLQHIPCNQLITTYTIVSLVVVIWTVEGGLDDVLVDTLVRCMNDSSNIGDSIDRSGWVSRCAVGCMDDSIYTPGRCDQES